MLFPKPKYTKLDLARYYLAVAEGALRGAGGRPNVLVRYPDGIGGEFFYQKRAPAARPDWIEVATIRFPSGREAEEVVPRDAAALAWLANLACLELHPHPVRAEDLDHPDELRVDLDPVPGVEWHQVLEVAEVAHAVLDGFPARRAGPRRPASAACTSACASSRAGSFDEVRRAALALAREVERRAPKLATSKWWKEERHGVFVDYNQNAKDRTVASALLGAPDAGRARLGAAGLGRSRRLRSGGFHARHHAGALQETGRPPRRHRPACAVPSSRCWNCSSARDSGDAPWPPHYKKQAGEPPGCSPRSRRSR